MIYHAILLVAAVFLIRATKKRDHNNMMFFMILMAIGVIISFIQLFSVGIAGLAFAILMAALDLYFFICIYSLYDLLRNERRGRIGQVQMQTQTVIYNNQQPITYDQHQPVNYNQQPPNMYQQQQPVMFQPELVVQPSAAPSNSDNQNEQKIALY
jgi:apolipoprotein N-acyltransferase